MVNYAAPIYAAQLIASNGQLIQRVQTASLRTRALHNACHHIDDFSDN